MKKLLIPALSAAVLSALSVAQAATFLNISDTTASAPPSNWAIGVQFTVPVASYIAISDISYFNVAAGNTLRLGLWNNTAANGYGNSLYATTIPSTSGSGLGNGGFTSVGAIAPIVLSAGSYTLTASGFSKPNSLGDTAYGNSVPVYSATTQATLTGLSDIQGYLQDPTFYNPVKGSFDSNPQRWKSVNFTYTVVPEPETYAMVAGAALVGFGLWRRRQAK